MDEIEFLRPEFNFSLSYRPLMPGGSTAHSVKDNCITRPHLNKTEVSALTLTPNKNCNQPHFSLSADLRTTNQSVPTLTNHPTKLRILQYNLVVVVINSIRNLSSTHLHSFYLQPHSLGICDVIKLQGH